jgi:hypothetical protein
VVDQPTELAKKQAPKKLPEWKSTVLRIISFDPS